MRSPYDDHEHAIKILATITNPNPRPIVIWHGDTRVTTLRPHDQVITPLVENLRVSCPTGRALVVMSLEGAEEEDDWLQDVRVEPVEIHPSLAVKKPKVAKAVGQSN